MMDEMSDGTPFEVFETWQGRFMRWVCPICDDVWAIPETADLGALRRVMEKHQKRHH